MVFWLCNVSLGRNEQTLPPRTQSILDIMTWQSITQELILLHCRKRPYKRGMSFSNRRLKEKWFFPTQVVKLDFNNPPTYQRPWEASISAQLEELSASCLEEFEEFKVRSNIQSRQTGLMNSKQTGIMNHGVYHLYQPKCCLQRPEVLNLRTFGVKLNKSIHHCFHLSKLA